MNDERELLDALTRYRIPQHMHGHIVAYILHGRPTGDFLNALLSNDLRLAVAKGDEENRIALAQWVKFLHMEAPMRCWGSPENVAEWLHMHMQNRYLDKLEAQLSEGL